MWITNNKVWYSEEEYKTLEQENEKLKRHKRELGNVAQGFIKDIDKEKLIAKEYKQALEEINTIIKQIKKEYSIISKFKEIAKIEKIINEVLK